MISFSKQIKSELISADLSAYCCSLAEFSSYVLLIGKRKQDSIEITVDSKEFAERITRIASRVLKANINWLELGGEYSILVKCGNKFMEKFNFLYSDYEDFDLLTNAYKKSCCRAAFLKGVFLSVGTLVDPEKTYNLEFSFKTEKTAMQINEIFKSSGFELKHTNRRNSKVLYVKNSDIICDIFTFIGAYKAQMKILNLKIEREIHNDVNRRINGETANYDKILSASIKHITAIEKISRVKGLDFLSQELFETATLRLTYRDLSLDELAHKFKTPVTKSGVYHRLNKIVKIAENM